MSDLKTSAVKSKHRGIGMCVTMLCMGLVECALGETTASRPFQLVSPYGIAEKPAIALQQTLILKRMNVLYRVKGSTDTIKTCCALPNSRTSMGCNLLASGGRILVSHDEGLFAVKVETGEWAKIADGIEIVRLLGISRDGATIAMTESTYGNVANADLLLTMTKIDRNGKGLLLRRNEQHPLAGACYLAGTDTVAVASGRSVDLYSTDWQHIRRYTVTNPIVDVVTVDATRLLLRERMGNDEDRVVDLRNGIESNISDGKYRIGAGGGRVVAIRDGITVVVLSEDGKWREVLKLEVVGAPSLDVRFWDEPIVSGDGRYACLRIGTTGRRGVGAEVRQWGIVLDFDRQASALLDQAFEQACWIADK